MVVYDNCYAVESLHAMKATLNRCNQSLSNYHRALLLKSTIIQKMYFKYNLRY